MMFFGKTQASDATEHFINIWSPALCPFFEGWYCEIQSWMKSGMTIQPKQKQHKSVKRNITRSSHQWLRYVPSNKQAVVRKTDDMKWIFVPCFQKCQFLIGRNNQKTRSCPVPKHNYMDCRYWFHRLGNVYLISNLPIIDDWQRHLNIHKQINFSSSAEILVNICDK